MILFKVVSGVHYLAVFLILDHDRLRILTSFFFKTVSTIPKDLYFHSLFLVERFMLIYYIDYTSPKH